MIMIHVQFDEPSILTQIHTHSYGDEGPFIKGTGTKHSLQQTRTTDRISLLKKLFLRLENR